MIVMANEDIDEVFEKCDSCATKLNCGLYASGQVIDCATISGCIVEYENMVPFTDELHLDERLENKFNDMMGVPRRTLPSLRCGV